MGSLFWGAAGAFWLGVLTSISPCPLATNIAAVSFIGRRLGSSRSVLLAGVLYTAGRTLAYLALGLLVVAGLLSIPGLSQFLQRYVNKLLGPILIVTGVFLLELLPLPTSGLTTGQKLQARVAQQGAWGAFMVGFLFALAFCPVSAALFFGSLIPLLANPQRSFLLPVFYGVGTGLPVVIFAFLIAFGARRVGSAFNRLSRFEWWAQRVTGGLFVLVGIYFCLLYIFGVPT